MNVKPLWILIVAIVSVVLTSCGGNSTPHTPLSYEGKLVTIKNSQEMQEIIASVENQYGEFFYFGICDLTMRMKSESGQIVEMVGLESFSNLIEEALRQGEQPSVGPITNSNADPKYKLALYWTVGKTINQVSLRADDGQSYVRNVTCTKLTSP